MLNLSSYSGSEICSRIIGISKKMGYNLYNNNIKYIFTIILSKIHLPLNVQYNIRNNIFEYMGL